MSESKRRARYTLEYKLEAVRLVKGGQVAAVTAKILGIPKQTLEKWVRLHGKGRKQRTVPLWKETVVEIRHWLQSAGLQKDQALLPNRWGKPMTRSNVAERLARAVSAATPRCPWPCRRWVRSGCRRAASTGALTSVGNGMASWPAGS